MTETVTAWPEQPLVAFDFESTGTDPKEARPVSAATAVLIADQGAPWHSNGGDQILINPGIEIPEGATEVHGITTEKVRADGVDAKQGIASVISLLVDLITTEVDSERYPRQNGVTTPIVAMNAAYDFSLLHYDALRHGVTPFRDVVSEMGLRVPIIDPYVLDKRVDRYRKGFRNLPALCEVYGVPGPTTAHEALSDAIAAARVAVKIGRLTPWLAEMTPAELHDSQIGWWREQCAGLQTYFWRYNPDKIVDPCWPACYPENHSELGDHDGQGALL